MSIMEKAIRQLVFGKKTITEPIFLKDFSSENKHLIELEKLSQQVSDKVKKELIDRDIAYLKAGIEGEKNVYFELKNSFLPFLCLYDVRLEDGDYVAQYDFILITNKFICVLETKKLNGNIIVNADGDFIRVIKDRNGRTIKREGMYSPVSQNERHVNILRNILLKNKLIKTMPILSLVVIANPKTIVDKSKCPSNLKKVIYKYDQITPFLKRLLNDPKDDRDVLEKYLYEIGNFLTENHSPKDFDLKAKYCLEDDCLYQSVSEHNETSKQQPDETSPVPSIKGKEVQTKVLDSKNKEQTYAALKEYRLLKSREENIKAFYIFTNAQLDELIEKWPSSEEELLAINGFGKSKVEKYGKDILRIITK